MLVEIDEVVVDVETFYLAKAGNKDALKALRRLCDGLVLSTHNLVVPNMREKICVTLRELEDIGVLSSVRLSSACCDQPAFVGNPPTCKHCGSTGGPV